MSGFDQAATAVAFRILRQPSRPSAPRPVAKSGSVAGKGVVGVGVGIISGKTHGAAHETLRFVGSRVKLSPPKTSCPSLISPGCNEYAKLVLNEFGIVEGPLL